MEDDVILSIIADSLSDTNNGNDYIEANNKNALNYYLGNKGEKREGKSNVISTDVADAIEWIMPEVMKAFTQNNEVVTFDPTSAEDAKQAEIESRFVYDVLMKDNEGFLILHQFFKDALMQKNGFVKVFYVRDEYVQEEAYTGLVPVELEMVQQDPRVEIVGQTITEVNGVQVNDINVERTINQGKMEILPVAPEDFRVSRMHNSLSLKDVPFSAHVMVKTASELVADGYDREMVDDLPEYSIGDNKRSYRFEYQGETADPDASSNQDKSQRKIEVAECYIMIDLEDKGIAKLHKITVAGGDNPTKVLDIEEIDENPFISTTAILMSHKLYGLSIYDRLKEIQDQKTALWRNILDNMYLQNNQRTIAVENMVNLDDLLVSRPGGIVRTKNLNAVAPFPTPQLSGDAYKMMDYLDQVRAGRAGVSPEGSVSDNMVGDRVGSQGVDRLMNQKEELVGLMIRVFAETGIKPLCYKIRRELIRHHDVEVPYEFRGDWVQVSPSSWHDRPRSTVRVGTGSGNRKEQNVAINNILMYQEKILANPGQSLVTEKQVFNTLNDLAKTSGLPGAGLYFLDPNSEEGKANKQQVDQSQKQQQEAEMKEKQVLSEAQAKIAQAEETKARTAEQNVVLTHQINQQKAEHDAYKTEADNQIKMLQQQLAMAKGESDAASKDADLEFKYWDAGEKHDIAREQMHLNAQNNVDEGTPSGSAKKDETGTGNGKGS